MTNPNEVAYKIRWASENTNGKREQWIKDVNELISKNSDLFGGATSFEQLVGSTKSIKDEDYDWDHAVGLGY